MYELDQYAKVWNPHSAIRPTNKAINKKLKAARLGNSQKHLPADFKCIIDRLISFCLKKNAQSSKTPMSPIIKANT